MTLAFIQSGHILDMGPQVRRMSDVVASDEAAALAAQAYATELATYNGALAASQKNGTPAPAAPTPPAPPSPVTYVAYPDAMVADVPATAQIGYLWDGTNATAPVVAPAPPQTVFTPLEFRALFPSDVLNALYVARRTNVSVDMFIDMVAMAGSIDITNAQVMTDVGSLVPAFLTTAQAQVILSGKAAQSVAPPSGASS